MAKKKIIYLDTNIFSGLHKQSNYKFIELLQIMEDEKDHLIYYYTDVHIKDQLNLGRQAHDESVLPRLNFISTLTDGNHIFFNDNENEFYEEKASPNDVYNRIKSGYLDLVDLSLFETEAEKLGFKPLLDLLFSQLKENFQETYQMNLKENDIKDSITSQMNSIFEQSNSLSDYIIKMYENSIKVLSEKQALKNQLYNPLLYARKDTKQSGSLNNMNKIQFLNYVQNEMKFNIFEITQNVIHGVHGEKGLYSDKLFYSTLYNTIDMIGYYQDNPKDKNKGLNNTINDSEHCFFATLANVYVSDDEKSRMKTKMVFDLLEHDNILVLDTEGFIKYLRSIE